jgi:hypothetical protein
LQEDAGVDDSALKLTRRAAHVEHTRGTRIVSRRRIGSHKKRGRPRKPNALRNQTTRAGRRGEAPPVDLGTNELRRRKRQVNAGREDLEVDAAAALHAHGHLDHVQFSTLGALTAMLRTAARSWGGGSDGGVTGLWNAVVAAGSRRNYFAPPTADDAVGPGDRARRRLGHILRLLDGSRALITALAEQREVPPIVLHVIEGQVDAVDKIMLAKLCDALDRIAGRRTPRAG